MTIIQAINSVQAVKNGTAPCPTRNEAIENVYRLTVEWEDTLTERALLRGNPKAYEILKKLSHRELAIWNELAAAKQILQFIMDQQKS